MKSSSYWLLLVVVLGGIYASSVVWRNRSTAETTRAAVVHASAVAVAEPVTEPLDQFTLTDQLGQPFNSDSLRGKVWVASFFFTNCPAVCWRLNQALAAIQQASPDSQVRYVSITCDPDNDTVEALAKYAEHFKADPKRWIFLTGDLAQILRIGKDFFKISVEKAGHTDRACVIDRKGQIRGRFRLTEPDQVEMLKKLIAQVEAEPDTTGPDTTAPAAEPAGTPPAAPPSAAAAAQ